MSTALKDIASERRRQIKVEGWSLEHDDSHTNGEMACAAAVYAKHSAGKRVHRPGSCPLEWPWAIAWWKPKDRRGDLVRAGALIVAEIERLDRHDRDMRVLESRFGSPIDLTSR